MSSINSYCSKCANRSIALRRMFDCKIALKAKLCKKDRTNNTTKISELFGNDFIRISQLIFL